MFNLLPRRLTRHHVLIVLLPMLDYLQNVMLMFGAGAILAGRAVRWQTLASWWLPAPS